MRQLMYRIAVATLPSYVGWHRGTPGQLMLQEARRAEQMTDWAHGILTEV